MKRLSTILLSLPSRKFLQHMSEISKESEIRIIVGLDEEKVPVNIQWVAQDGPEGEQMEECKAMLVSLFSREHLETAKIDLWTKDMQVNEMDRFMFQTLRGLADTYFRATQNTKLAQDMQRFVQYFGEQTEILEKGK
jgi:gliding motility-associated protein GldC